MDLSSPPLFYEFLKTGKHYIVFGGSGRKHGGLREISYVQSTSGRDGVGGLWFGNSSTIVEWLNLQGERMGKRFRSY